MIRYHTCGYAIWMQKTWDGLKHYRAFYDPMTKRHITHCPKCEDSLRNTVLYTKAPDPPETDMNWLWSRLREELGEERTAELRTELRERQQNGYETNGHSSNNNSQ